jgi:hypothetical protein
MQAVITRKKNLLFPAFVVCFYFPFLFVEAAQCRDEKAGYDAYVIRQYMEPQLVIDEAIDKICT